MNDSFTPIIITKNKPYKTIWGELTYEYLKSLKPDESTGLYCVKGVYTTGGVREFNPPLRVKLIDLEEYEDHGNGD